MYQANRGKDQAQVLDRLPVRVFLLLGVALLSLLVVFAVLEGQAGVTAYVKAEGLWSKMQKQGAFALYRYAGTGDVADLAEARASLATPLRDREFRRAMDAGQPFAVARAELVAAGNDPKDIDRIVWVYYLFRDAPFFRDSVTAWRNTDHDLDALVHAADELGARRAQGALSAADVAAYQQRFKDINAQVYPLTLAFSNAMSEGGSVLRHWLLGCSGVVFFLLAAYAIRIMRSTLTRVRETEGEFHMAFHQAAVGMLKIEPEGRILQANEAVGKIAGMAMADLLDVRVQDIVLIEDLSLNADGSLDWRALGEAGERRLLREDGSVRWVRWTPSQVAGRGDASRQLFVLLEDVTDAHDLAEEIAHQASHDELTGLINRREIVRRLGHSLAQVRDQARHHVLCYIDLDQFKLVNDTCGHRAGDQYLRRFADLLRGLMRERDWLGRLGGDEFALLLRDVDLRSGEEEMQRLHEALARAHFQWDGRSFALNCSVGMVPVNADSGDVEWLVGAADSACYLAKHEGRRRVRLYDAREAHLAERMQELEWVSGAQRAIAERRLVLHAQRIVGLQGAPGLRYEILMRVRDNDGILHPPTQFLAAMERFGQAVMVDRHVVNEVMAELRRSPDHCAELDLCHINVSAQSIADPAFRGFVAGHLDTCPELAPKLCFEITETAMIDNLGDARRFVDEVRRRGARVALDDFGSGLSSFAYLKTLPVDIVKIDGVFIRDLDEDGADLALVRSMAQIIRALGKEAVAEGVETGASASQLARIGIGYAQGYAMHMPGPLRELTAPRLAEVG